MNSSMAHLRMHELFAFTYLQIEYIFSCFVVGLGRYIDYGSILRFSECIASPQESILSLDFNSRWRSNLHENSHEERWRALVRSAESVILPRLRMLLWREINVNTAHCEHPCNSLQPFLILWMIILGSSVCKDLETSRVRLFLKHAVPSTVQN